MKRYKCIKCGAKLPSDNYEIRGNYCIKCNNVKPKKSDRGFTRSLFERRKEEKFKL